MGLLAGELLAKFGLEPRFHLRPWQDRPYAETITEENPFNRAALVTDITESIHGTMTRVEVLWSL